MPLAAGVPGELGEAPGLYVHLPYCTAVCPYCDFAVRRGDAAATRATIDAIVDEAAALAEGKRPTAVDLEADAQAARGLASAVDALLTGPAFDTIYLGGGTPSLAA
ncbi:MAG: hypothetical protein AAGN46_14910, partial [Acidobacteriota bacterium]